MPKTMASTQSRTEEDEDPHMGLAADIMDFIRDSGCIDSIDLGVWLFRGNAEDQLAGYLSERISDASFPGLRLVTNPDLV